jgi:hypothetical protein
LTPCTLWNHTCSIGDDTLIFPELTTTNREMIHISFVANIFRFLYRPV